MIRFTPRARATVAASAAAVGSLLLGACNPKQELLAPQQPGVIAPADIQNSTGAEALYIGAIGRLTRAMNGGGGNLEGLWNEQALFTDEVKSADTFSQRNDADQRNLQNNDADLEGIYDKTQQVRGFARTAINALAAFDTTSIGRIHRAEMYMVMGYAEMQLSSVFCNGIPFGETVNGAPVYTAPITDAAGSALAISRIDTALAILGSGSDSASLAVKYAALIVKARAQVDLGNYADAATTVAPVPTNWSYSLNYSVNTADNEWWVMGDNVKRYSAGDSIAFIAGGTTAQILNAIPFGSLNDPRVPVVPASSGNKAEDGSTPYVAVEIWGRDDPTALAWGGDARLIEAENQLHLGNISGMMTILNNLRTNAQTVAAFKVAPMPALPTPTAAQATDVFFREKALWQFERGYRMDDLRRLVRQYGRTQDNVFPSGTFVLKSQPAGTYGSQTNFPVTDDEKTNPLFTGCIDRNP